MVLLNYLTMPERIFEVKLGIYGSVNDSLNLILFLNV